MLGSLKIKSKMRLQLQPDAQEAFGSFLVVVGGGGLKNLSILYR